MADADAPACSYPPRPKAAAAPAAPAPAAEAHKTAFATTSLAEVKDGRFVRTASVYRNKIEKGGEFPPAAGRYHLYVSLACPWAHRVIIFRKLKGLEKAIPMSVVYPIWGEAEPGIKGWVFEKDGKNIDQVAHLHSLRLVYKHFNPAHEGKATTPLLVDTKTNRIVNNESSELVVFLNNEFNEFAEHPEVNLLPADLKSKVEDIDKYMYDSINNGVYRCGFATSQAAYEEAFHQLFEALDHMEALLAKQRFLVSNTLVTEADIRLFVTLIRFDAVYVTHFKTNKKRIADYPNLLGFVRDVYQHKGVGETVDFWHIKNHYFGSHPGINPHLIVPLGPDLPDYNAPSGRAHFSA